MVSHQNSPFFPGEIPPFFPAVATSWGSGPQLGRRQRPGTRTSPRSARAPWTPANTKKPWDIRKPTRIPIFIILDWGCSWIFMDFPFLCQYICNIYTYMLRSSVLSKASTRKDEKGPILCCLVIADAQKARKSQADALAIRLKQQIFDSTSWISAQPSLDTKGTGMNWRDAQVRCSDFPDLALNKCLTWTCYGHEHILLACWSLDETMEIYGNLKEIHECSSLF